jgi:hypothetical protein
MRQDGKSGVGAEAKTGHERERVRTERRTANPPVLRGPTWRNVALVLLALLALILVLWHYVLA